MSPATANTTTAAADTLMPPMTFGDFENALRLVAAGRRHTLMVPFLVSALSKQAPFLNGEALMVEILSSAVCLADLPEQDFDA